MEHDIQSASGDESDLLSLGMQSQFQHTVGSIAHQLDGAIRQPAAHQADHLLCPRRNCLMPLAQLFTHGLRVVVRTHKKGKAQRCLVQGRVTTTAITIQRKPGLRTSCLRLERALSR